MKTSENRKHAAAIAAACIALAALVVLGTVIISYWNTPIAKTESRTMQAMLLQEDGSAEPCTVLISGISYHYLFRNHADSFEATEPGGVFVNGQPHHGQPDPAVGHRLGLDVLAGRYALVRRGRRAVHRTAAPRRGGRVCRDRARRVLVIAPAETKQEAQALLQSLRETRGRRCGNARLIEPFLK